jgi:hypothetical protein
VRRIKRDTGSIFLVTASSSNATVVIYIDMCNVRKDMIMESVESPVHRLTIHNRSEHTGLEDVNTRHGHDVVMKDNIIGTLPRLKRTCDILHERGVGRIEGHA